MDDAERAGDERPCIICGAKRGWPCRALNGRRVPRHWQPEEVPPTLTPEEMWREHKGWNDESRGTVSGMSAGEPAAKDGMEREP